eukprot:1898634-Rhodomonas_salina.2
MQLLVHDHPSSERTQDVMARVLKHFGLPTSLPLRSPASKACPSSSLSADSVDRVSHGFDRQSVLNTGNPPKSNMIHQERSACAQTTEIGNSTILESRTRNRLKS